MDEQFNFDLNFDFLDSSTSIVKENLEEAVGYQSTVVQPIYDIESLATRIASVNDLSVQLRTLKSEHLKLRKQMQELSDSAMSIRSMYEREKNEKAKYALLSEELQEKCNQADSQLANKTLHFDQLVSKIEQSTEKGPIPYDDLALRYYRLAMKLEDDKLLHYKEKATLQQMQEYIDSKELAVLPPIKKKSQPKKQLHDQGVQCCLRIDTKSKETQCMIKRKTTCNQGTQYTWYTTTRGTNTPAFGGSKKTETRSQGTQYISSMTTRGTSTTAFIKTHNVGTNFPEVVPVSIEDIFKEMICDVAPLSPMHESPCRLEDVVLPIEKKSIGTNTGLRNVRKQIDYVAPTIKHSESRPPSRNLCDRIKNEMPFVSMPTMNPFVGLGLSPPPMHSTVAELWNMLGQTIFALLQNSSAQLNPMHTTLMNDRMRNLSADITRQMERQRPNLAKGYYEDEVLSNPSDYLPTTRSTATSPISAATRDDPDSFISSGMEEGTSFVNGSFLNSTASSSAFVSLARSENYSQAKPTAPVEIQKILLNRHPREDEQNVEHCSDKSSAVDDILKLFPDYSSCPQRRKAIKRLLRGSKRNRKPKKETTTGATQHQEQLHMSMEEASIAIPMVECNTAIEQSTNNVAMHSCNEGSDRGVDTMAADQLFEANNQLHQSNEVFCKPLLPLKYDLPEVTYPFNLNDFRKGELEPLSVERLPHMEVGVKTNSPIKQRRFCSKRKRRTSKSDVMRSEKNLKVNEDNDDYQQDTCDTAILHKEISKLHTKPVGTQSSDCQEQPNQQPFTEKREKQIVLGRRQSSPISEESNFDGNLVEKTDCSETGTQFIFPQIRIHSTESTQMISSRFNPVKCDDIFIPPIPPIGVEKSFESGPLSVDGIKSAPHIMECSTSKEIPSTPPKITPRVDNSSETCQTGDTLPNSSLPLSNCENDANSPSNSLESPNLQDSPPLDLSVILKTPEKAQPLLEFKTPKSCTFTDRELITNSTEKLVEDFILNGIPEAEGQKFEVFLGKILDDYAPPQSPISVLDPSDVSEVDTGVDSFSDQEVSKPEKTGNTSRKNKRKAPATSAIAVKRSARLKAKNIATITKSDLSLLNIPGVQLGKYTKRKTEATSLHESKLDEAASLIEEKKGETKAENICDMRMGFFRDLSEDAEEQDSSTEKLIIDEECEVAEQKTKTEHHSETDDLPSLMASAEECPLEEISPPVPDPKQFENSETIETSSGSTEMNSSSSYPSMQESSTETSDELDVSPLYFDECPYSPSQMNQEPELTHITREFTESQLVDVKPCSSSLLSHIIANYNPQNHKLYTEVRQTDMKLLTQIQTAINSFVDGLGLLMDIIRTVDAILNITTNGRIIAQAIISIVKTAPRPETEVQPPIPELYLSQMLRKLISLLEPLHKRLPSLRTNIQTTIEQSLFTFVKDIIPLEVLMNLTQFYLATIANPESTTNPARLFICKCLYFYNQKAHPMIYETLCVYPSVLPKRDDTSYDRSDALINTIQCLLMSTFYDVEKTDLKTRQLFTKLKKYYNYDNFKPPRDEVIGNLIAKIEVNRFKNVSYAFSLICKRIEQKNAEKVLNSKLLPLANQYYHQLKETTEHDEKVACVLECISFIIKPFTLNTDITTYVNLFDRFLNATERKIVQEAAVAAILRTMRFGYVHCFNAIYNYQPTYELADTTKAMLRSFVYKKSLDFLKRLDHQAKVLLTK